MLSEYLMQDWEIKVETHNFSLYIQIIQKYKDQQTETHSDIRERERERERMGDRGKNGKFWALREWVTLLSILTIFLFESSECFNYSEALSQSLLYFESQRSGRLPHNQRVTWRYHSALTDGLDQKVKLRTFSHAK